MNKFCIATHGRLAEGFGSALSILTGEHEGLTVVNAYVDETDHTERIEAFLQSIGPEDTGVVFTDVLGGSVFQQVMLRQADHPDVLHVTGVNLGLIIEVLCSGAPITADFLRQCVDSARDSMQLVEAPSAASDDSEPEDDFFD